MEHIVGNEPRIVDPPEVLARVTEGLPLVDIIARQMRRQFGAHVQVDDLASQGREALLAAARSFDAERGIPFRRWANLRIRGAMIDSVRQSGSLPKRVYRKLRALQAADLVHDAANEEQAAAPPQTAEAADARVGDQLASAAMAMALSFLSPRRGEALESAKDPDHSPESNVGHAQLIARIKLAIAELPDQERTLLTRHYFDEVNLDEAARELGLSKSWASRLHARGIEAIARHFKRARIGP
ncbi:MAG: sigma-70 family RNA polymerase sigma factor [Labilithrix sp.]|nr:sigma-70 family RNA polymerase sigma factor [Labilithrix sp.]MBX3212080.1 sigma-70 family RNA polymerase sigma factor [Labilithrix sp.]